MLAIADTGPLVAFFDQAEQHHRWAIAQIEAMEAALLVHEPVQLMRKYRDTPMSLADACLVRMAEVHEQHAVMTLDRDFLVYRKNGRVPLGLIHPDAQP